MSSQLLEYIRSELKIVLEQPQSDIMKLINRTTGVSTKNPGVSRIAANRLKDQMEKRAAQAAVDLEIENMAKKFRTKSQKLFDKAARGSSKAKKAARNQIAKLMKKKLAQKLAAYAAGTLTTGPVGAVIAVVGTAGSVVAFAKMYAESQIGGMKTTYRTLPGRSQAEIADDIARLEKRLKQHEKIGSAAWKRAAAYRPGEKRSWDEVKQDFVKQIAALKKERNKPQIEARFKSALKQLEKSKEIDYTKMDPEKLVRLAQDVGAAVGGLGVGALSSKKSSGKGKRHPLRAKQERLSRKIKVPVAKIQDMLKPYFAGGGSLTFKESINRNIILEGDGAYGDETEAAIKAFQAQVNDLIEKGILKGVKPLGTPDGLFGPATLRAFNALKKQPEALAQSKLGSAQVDPNTLAGGAKQAAAQAAAGAKPAADQGPPAPQKSNFITLGQQKGFFGNSLKLLINSGGGSQTFTALKKIWQDSNIEDTPPPQELLKMYGTFLVKTTLTPDTEIPNQEMLNQLPNPIRMEDYIEGVLYKQVVVDQLSNPNSAIYKLTSRLFKTQDALQLFLKQPDNSVAKVTNAEKKKVEKPFYEIDKDIEARKKIANESKAYTYLKKIINEELDKILG